MMSSDLYPSGSSTKKKSATSNEDFHDLRNWNKVTQNFNTYFQVCDFDLKESTSKGFDLTAMMLIGYFLRVNI